MCSLMYVKTKIYLYAICTFCDCVVATAGRIRLWPSTFHWNPIPFNFSTRSGVNVEFLFDTSNLYCLRWDFTQVLSWGLAGNVLGTLQWPLMDRNSLSSQKWSSQTARWLCHTKPRSTSAFRRYSDNVEFEPSCRSLYWLRCRLTCYFDTYEIIKH